MKTNRRRVACIALTFLSALIVGNGTARAALTTNFWQGLSGKWETSTNWSEGAPSITQAVVFVSDVALDQPNIITTIDATTAGSFSGTMTISNLVIGDATLLTSHELIVSNTGTVTPLHILNSAMVTNHGSVFLTNSTMRIDGPPTNTLSKGALAIEGSVTVVANSTLIAQTTTNSLEFGEAVGVNGSGTLIIAGGTNLVGFSSLVLGENINGFGTVLITDGALLVTNTVDGFASGIDIGNNGAGSLTQSNGFVKALAESMGRGTLTVAAGTHLTGSLDVDGGFESTGTVWVTGGELLVTNGASPAGTVLGTDTSGSSGILTVSNGVFATSLLMLGFNAGDAGTLIVAGGTAMMSSNVLLGNAVCTASGYVLVEGGNLFVTNAAHNATLEIRDGTFTLNSGTVTVDRFVVTNACAHFVRTGGTLAYGTAVLNPTDDTDGDGIPNSSDLQPLNPANASMDSDGDGFTDLQEYLAHTDPANSASALRILSIATVGNTVTVTWQGGRGVTNALDRALGASGGGYSNNFSQVSSVFQGGSGLTTNVFGQIGVTNSSLYFRARLVQ